jgi:anti-sigma B factor antagonist
VEREPRAQLTVKATRGSNGLLVTVSGELDMAVADELFDIVLKQLADEPNLTLDFAQVTFCDSSGIRSLVHLYNHQADAGGTLRLINTTHAVRRVIETTGLAEYLGINDP